MQREYLPQYVEWLNDWQVNQFLAPGIPYPLNIDDEIEWFEQRRKSKDSFVFDFNPRAIRAYAKTGFRREGVRRQGLYRNGKFHDVYLMDILREEWEALK